ncbi:MAG: hypothetical protein U0324_11545 [Polyangiales bacterium]
MEIGFSTLDRRRLEDLKDTDFERFCEELVRFEARERHVDAAVRGPLRSGEVDGGKDLLLVVQSPPRRSRAQFPEALTEDGLSETFFSCKAGADWQADVKDDAARKGGMARVLARGGRFTLLVNRPVDVERLTESAPKASKARARKSFVRQVAELASKAMAGARKKPPSVEEIEARITIYDANAIVAFLRVHRPSLGAEFKRALGIVEPPGVVSVERWRLEQKRGPRKLPDFARDAARERAIAELLAMFEGGESRAVWIDGAPGIGKTRLVLEALTRARDHQPRVCVAPREPVGAEALERYDLVAKMPEVILVIDECPASRVHLLYSKFAAAVDDCGEAARRACLVLIGPPGEAIAPLGLRRMPLEPLGDDALRQVIEREYRGDAAQVDAVLRLAEGFPWYAVLLAREFGRSNVSPTDGADTSFAAKVAIAPLPTTGSGDDEWRREVLARARALLAVILLERRPWPSRDEAARTALFRAVGLPSWEDLNDRIRACVERGLIRQSEDTEFRYVTPAVLAREVLILLLTPPGGGGPSLCRHAPELADGLHERLSEFGVPDGLQRELARETLDDWRNARTLPELARRASRRSLLFVATRCPLEAATYLREVTARPFPQEEAPRAIAAVAPALGHLLSRRGCFAEAEGALFPLVVAERGESMRPATDVWARSLMPAWGETYATHRERADTLARRVRSAGGEDRLAALAALDAVASSNWWTVRTPLDGEWPRPDPTEVVRATAFAWHLLAERTADPDPSVAHRAQAIVCRHVRNAVRAGVALDAVGELSRRANGWPDASRSDLRAALDLIDRYDGAFVASAPGLAERLAALRAALEPRTWRDRLFDRVAHWHPGASKASDERDADRALAREGIANGDLDRSLDWLDGPDARRANVFMRGAGEVDEARALLPHLLQRVRSGASKNPLLLPHYLGGMADGGAGDEVISLLRSWRGEPALARTTFMTTWLLGASEEGVAWILEDLRAGDLWPSDLHLLESGPWDRDVSWRAVEPLVTELLGAEAAHATQLAASLLNRRLRRDPDLADAIAPQLARALARLMAGAASGEALAAHECEVGLDQLLALGRRGEVLELASEALRRGPESAGFEHAWKALLQIAQDDAVAVWQRVAPVLDGPRSDELRWDWRWQALGRLLPADEVLSWIGDDFWRARVAGSFAVVTEAPLPHLTRSLLIRFGARGDVASILYTRVLSAPPQAESHASFLREQVQRAHAWAADEDPEVATWARRCEAGLRESAERSLRADVG